MVTAEAAQKLRLPLLSKDGDIHDEEIESILSQSSPNSPGTSFTIGSSSNSPNSSGASTFSATNNNLSPRHAPVEEPALGGLPNFFLGITLVYLWKTQFQVPTNPCRCGTLSYMVLPYISAFFLIHPSFYIVIKSASAHCSFYSRYFIIYSLLQ